MKVFIHIHSILFHFYYYAIHVIDIIIKLNLYKYFELALTMKMRIRVILISLNIYSRINHSLKLTTPCAVNKNLFRAPRDRKSLAWPSLLLRALYDRYTHLIWKFSRVPLPAIAFFFLLCKLKDSKKSRKRESEIVFIAAHSFAFPDCEFQAETETGIFRRRNLIQRRRDARFGLCRETILRGNRQS